MIIRAASIQDAEAIAQVHVESWRTTYKGIIADEVLEKMKVEPRQKSWEWEFRHPNPDQVYFVAVEEETGTIVGFVTGGGCRSKECGYDGELYAIYLLQAYQGNGIGRQLVQQLVRSLKENHYTSMMLWVLEDNPSVAFYRKLGGLPFQQKVITIGPDQLAEIAYGWSTLDELKID